MTAITTAVLQAGTPPDGQPAGEQLVRLFNSARDALAGALHEGQPTLTEMRASAVALRFPAQVLPKEEPAREEPLPLVFCVSEATPDWFRCMTAIGVHPDSNVHPDEISRRLVEGMNAHAAKLEQMVSDLAAAPPGGKTASVTYEDLVARNPRGLELVDGGLWPQRELVRSPNHPQSYIQVKTSYHA